MTDPNYSAIVDATPLIPTNTLVHVTAGPHRGKKGRARSASGDGHILVDAHGEKSPIRVHKDHVTKASELSKAVDESIRAMARSRRS